MKYWSLVIVMLVSLSSFGQEIKYCGQNEMTEKLFERFPHLKNQVEETDRLLNDATFANYANRGGDEELVYIIPVVFHVIHDNGFENISDEQIYDAIDVLNEDFRKLNGDINQVVSEFQDITADIKVEFRLAQKDPEGICHKGINRIISPLTYDGYNDQLKSLIFWPRDMYLNIWVCNDIPGGVVGFTYLPAAVDNGWLSDEDGIVVQHNYCGSIGTSNYFRSRTLTHEVGHWINLMHTWGSGNSVGTFCGDDLCPDTPETMGWQSCDLDGESCGTLDNVQNYMDYSFCSKMFTEDQKIRMRTALESDVAQRNNLWTESNLEATGVLNDEQILCKALFEVNVEQICEGQSITVTDYSYHGVTEWTWDFGDGEILTGTDAEVYQNPTHTYTSPGSYDITLTVSNGIDEVSLTKENLIQVLGGGELDSPFEDGFQSEFPAENWFVFNEFDNEEWQIYNYTGFESSKSLRLRNITSDIEGERDHIVSSTYDMSEFNQVMISYKWAYANKPETTDDRLRVYISNDCGESWILKKMHRGYLDLPTADATTTSFVPDDDEWTGNTIIIDNPDQIGASFRVKFDFEAKGGNNIYLDNINIYGQNVVGIEEVYDDHFFSIYPNPVSGGTLNIEVRASNASETTLEIYDLSGRLIVNEQLMLSGSNGQTIPVDISSVSAGLYTVNIRFDDQRWTRKLIVK